MINGDAIRKALVDLRSMTRRMPDFLCAPFIVRASPITASTIVSPREKAWQAQLDAAALRSGLMGYRGRFPHPR